MKDEGGRMKRSAVLVLLIAVVVAGCSSGPTAEQIDATVNARVASTIAALPTNTVEPTATSLPTSTATPRPTNTPRPTARPEPTETPDANQILKLLNGAFEQFDVLAKAIDVTYGDGTKGTRTILHIDLQSTATPYDGSTAVSTIGVIAQLLKQGIQFETGLIALNVSMYDNKMVQKSLYVVDWQDVVDYASGKIDSQQLALRLQIFP